MSAPTLESVTAELDKWVSRHGNGKYVDATLVPLDKFAIQEDHGIQQDRQEIMDFVARLLQGNSRGTALEVGLGYFGSTHFLWRLLFDRVITVEKSHDRVRSFGVNLREYYKDQPVLSDGKSSFLIGSSHEPGTIRKAYDYLNGPQVDMLFIDGDHAYNAVLADWLVYAPLVKQGGIVAFHDVVLSIEGYYGVPEFLKKLGAGGVDGRLREIKTIAHTTTMGIGYYIQS